VPFMFCRKAVKLGSEAGFAALGKEELYLSLKGHKLYSNLLTGAEAFSAGALQSGLLAPSRGLDLRSERLINGISGGAAFLTFELASQELSKHCFKNSASLFAISEKSRLGNFAVHAGIYGLAGAASGAAASEVHSILTNGELANNCDLAKNAWSMAITGVGFAGIKSLNYTAPDAVWVGKDGSFNSFRSQSGLGDGKWQSIFEKSFPADEIQEYSFLNSLTKPGANPEVKLHTSIRNGETSAFSISSNYGNGSEGAQLLLAYIATDPSLRSKGIAARHLRALSESYINEQPSARGLLIEVENPESQFLTNKEQALQRLKFYDRQGAKVITDNYLIPSTEAGQAPLEGKLLFLPFKGEPPSQSGLQEFVKNIYVKGYELSPEDPFVQSAVGGLKKNEAVSH
ncbi:MAG: hypothetical protein K2X27_01820, partial [Candidatus Obscuribacterales bacterium]|nr:hypothetical protein [Candidatus Obscuribacterales bacterium]